MFPSWEIDIKLSQIYMKIHIYAILYKSFSIKQIIFNTTNLKQWYPMQEPENLRFAPILIFLKFYFAFLIDIIESIITYSS